MISQKSIFCQQKKRKHRSLIDRSWRNGCGTPRGRTPSACQKNNGRLLWASVLVFLFEFSCFFCSCLFWWLHWCLCCLVGFVQWKAKNLSKSGLDIMALIETASFHPDANTSRHASNTLNTQIYFDNITHRTPPQHYFECPPIPTAQLRSCALAPTSPSRPWWRNRCPARCRHSPPAALDRRWPEAPEGGELVVGSVDL